MQANFDWVPDSALWSLGLTVLGWLVGHWTGLRNGRRSERAAQSLAEKNRIRKANDDFGSFIRRQIGTIPQTDVKAFYTKTKPAIREAVDVLWHYCAADDRSRLNAIWAKYDQIPDTHLDKDREDDWEREARMIGGTSYPHPRDVVKEHLEEFYKFLA